MKTKLCCMSVQALRLGNQNGNVVFLSLGLLVSIGIIFSLGIDQLSQAGKATRDFQVVNSRNTVVSHMKKYSSIGATFRSSLDPSLSTSINAALHNCIFGGGPSLCRGAGTVLPITLYYPVTMTAGSLTKSLKILSGPAAVGSTPARPALYTLKGTPCAEDITVASPTCPFEVFSAFTAKCAADAPSCITAESISVQYTVRVSPHLSGAGTGLGGLLTLASINQIAPSITRTEILPGTEEKSSGNVMVTILTISDTEVVTSTVVKPVIDPGIIAAVTAGGVTNSRVAYDLALAFQAGGVTDPSFITSVVTAGLSHWGDKDDTKIIMSIIGAGITNVQTASIIAKAGITSPSWALIVAQSGITNTNLAGELQGSNIKSPTQLAAIVAAVAGVGNPIIAEEIAKNGVTDSNVANSIWSSVSSIQNIDIARSIVDAGFTDPTQITSIANAVSIIPGSEVAAALAGKGLTDPVLAKTLWNIVSVIKDPDDAADIAVKGLTNPNVAISLVAEYLIDVSIPKVSSTTNTTNNTSTTTVKTTTTTTSTAKTTTGTATPITPQPMPPTITLLSTCTEGQCTTPAF
jgi:hypothetical protein